MKCSAGAWGKTSSAATNELIQPDIRNQPPRKCHSEANTEESDTIAVSNAIKNWSAPKRSPSAQTQPAIHDQCLSGDKITAGYQSYDRVGDFIRRGNALQWISGRSLFDDLLIFFPVMF